MLDSAAQNGVSRHILSEYSVSILISQLPINCLDREEKIKWMKK